MDNELFELCKEVSAILPITDDIDYYLRWSKPNNVFMKVNRWQYDEDSRRYAHKAITPQFNAENEVAPLYTSDYLLDKLPKFSPVAKDAYLTVIEKQTPKDKREDFYWTAGYFTGSGWSYTGQSDTPLKALLKLTIELHEAGELK